MAFLGPFNAAVVNPSLVTLAKDFHKTTTVISYSTTVSIIMGGLSVSLIYSLYLERWNNADLVR